ncbi:MAG: PEP-CTERM sorting domain-containing protein [Planctomycetaceae bacterium]
MKKLLTPALRDCVASVTILVSWAATASADLVWGAATNISGDSDVSTAGTLLVAVNPGTSSGGGVAPTVTVNGVTFTGWSPGGFGAQVDPSGHLTLTAEAGFGAFSSVGFGSGGAPFSALSADYQTLLDYGDFAANAGQNDFTGDLTLTISGLTVNHQYEFQWWTNDSRPFSTGPVTATSGATSVSLDPNTTNAAGGTGQYVIGTFIATAATESIVFSTTGNGNVQNAFQVRDLTVAAVPEPNSFALLTLALILCVVKRRMRAG